MKTTKPTTLTVKNNLMPVLSVMSYFGILIALFFVSDALFAGTTSAPEGSVGAISNTVRSSMQNVAALITAVSYVAGIGFAMMGLLKLKAHKDNPTQVPLSQPMTLLVIAAGLVFLPSLIKSAGATIWGDKSSLAGTSGAGDKQEEGALFK